MRISTVVDRQCDVDRSLKKYQGQYDPGLGKTFSTGETGLETSLTSVLKLKLGFMPGKVPQVKLALVKKYL